MYIEHVHAHIFSDIWLKFVLFLQTTLFLLFSDFVLSEQIFQVSSWNWSLVCKNRRIIKFVIAFQNCSVFFVFLGHPVYWLTVYNVGGEHHASQKLVLAG